MEVPSGPGEADRGSLDVVVPVVDEVEDLGRVLRTVDAPGVALVGVPRAGPGTAAEALGESQMERGEPVAPRVTVTGVHLLGLPWSVVVVDVGVGVGVVSAQ